MSCYVCHTMHVFHIRHLPRYIFEHVGKQFFRSLGAIAHCQRHAKILEAEKYNIGKPPEKTHRVPYVRYPEPLSDETSDTASSSDADEAAKFIERSAKITPHAVVHLADQVIRAGTHSFYDTDKTEAAHPECLGLANRLSQKGRHTNATTRSMHKYLMDRHMIQKILQVSDGAAKHQPIIPQPRCLKSITITSAITGTDLAFQIFSRGSRGMITSKTKLDRSTWDTVIHEGVPLSIRELVDTVADNLRLSVTRETASMLLMCTWRFGWHIKSVVNNGDTRIFRGGGVTPGTTSTFLRGDWVETDISDHMDGVVTTSRLARVICAIRLGDVHRHTGLVFPVTSDHYRLLKWETEQNRKDDVLHLLLVRYAQPSPRARGRGPHHRPLCPGIMRDTHCLWEWAKRSNSYKRGCFRGRSWDRNKHFFGDTVQSQNYRRDMERLAWYDVIQISDIRNHTNVQLDPDRQNTFLQSVMWW